MKKLSSLILFLFLSLFSIAKEVPSSPNPPRLVNDFTGVLDASQVQNLEAKLKAYNDSTSTQVAIVIENSLEGDDIFDYCQRLSTAWGIGVKGRNNGILIYVAIDDRKMRIHVGYGMEATITDGLTKRIIDQVMKPAFKQQDYYGGLEAVWFLRFLVVLEVVDLVEAEAIAASEVLEVEVLEEVVLVEVGKKNC
jgi:uncharacterized protein